MEKGLEKDETDEDDEVRRPTRARRESGGPEIEKGARGGRLTERAQRSSVSPRSMQLVA